MIYIHEMKNGSRVSSEDHQHDAIRLLLKHETDREDLYHDVSSHKGLAWKEFSEIAPVKLIIGSRTE